MGGVGGRSLLPVLGLGIVCAVMAAGSAAESDSGSRRDCLDYAKDGPAMVIQRKSDNCKVSDPAQAGQHRRNSKDVPGALPGATVDDLLGLIRNFNPELAAAALDREAAVAAGRTKMRSRAGRCFGDATMRLRCSRCRSS